MLINQTKQFLKDHNFRGYNVGFGHILGPDSMNISVWGKKDWTDFVQTQVPQFLCIERETILEEVRK